MNVVDKQSALDNWDIIGKYLLDAIRQGGEHSLREVRDLVESDALSIFQVTDGMTLRGIGAMSVQETIINGAFEKMLNIAAIAGDNIRAALPDLVPWLEKVAKDEGCAGLVMTGRRGWVRRLGPHGFKKARYILHKVF